MAENILVLRRIRPMQHAFLNEVFDLFPMELTEFSHIDGMLHCELHSHKAIYCCWLCVCVRVYWCVCGQKVNIFVKKVELWIDNFCDRDRETQSVILYWNVCVCE